MFSVCFRVAMLDSMILGEVDNPRMISICFCVGVLLLSRVRREVDA